mgnify:CR=1 FL=1
MQQSIINRIFQPKILGVIILAILLLLFVGIKLSETPQSIEQTPSPQPTTKTQSYFDINQDDLPEMTSTQQLTASQSASLTWQFLFTDHQFEAEVPVYRWENEQLTLTEAEDVAKKLKLSGQPIRDEEQLQWVSEDQQRILKVSLIEGEWIYQDFNQSFPEDFTDNSRMFVTEDEVKKIATDFLFRHGFYDYLLSTYQPIQCFGGQHHPYLVEDVTQAESCQVQLNRELNGYLVYKNNGVFAGGVAEVSQFQKVQKLTLNYPQVQQSNQLVEISDLEAAKQQIRIGNGQLILDNPQIPLNNQTTARITKVSLGYLDAVNNKFLLPVWVFEGTVENNRLTSQLMILLSAIKK